MKTNRIELLNILEKIKPGISSKESIESMKYFVFSGTNIITYNNKISIQHPFESDFQLFVKADDLYRVIEKLSIDKLTLQEKNEKLNIRCNSLNANLATIVDDEVNTRINNINKSLKDVKWQKLPDDFCSSILLCSYTASNQESDQTLTCVTVNDNNCISSDNNRVSHAIMSGKVDEMFIKASEIKNLVNINPTEYAITKAWLHFRNDDKCIFSIRKIEGEFPDFLQFFDFKGEKVNLPNALVEGMDIAAILADVNDPSITIKINSNYCMILVKSESGTMQYRSKIKYNGNDIEFIINPEFLKQMMIHSSSLIISKDKARLQTDDKRFQMLTALFV